MNTRRVYNYELQPEGKQVILMPRNADIIGLTEKYGFPFLLAVIDEFAKLEPRIFRIATTGQVFNSSVLDYIGTLRLGGEDSNGAWYTMHVFEVETALALPEHHAEPIDPRNDKYRDDLSTLRTELEGRRKVDRDTGKPNAFIQSLKVPDPNPNWPDED